MLLALFIAAAPDPAFKVIVHPSNAQRKLTRQQIADMFLLRNTEWENNVPVAVVDQTFTSPVRAAFSTQVLLRTVAAVKSFWQQVIFSGRGVPPPERGSDAAVVAFVLQNAGAIGYVSHNAKIGDAVVVTIKEE